MSYSIYGAEQSYSRYGAVDQILRRGMEGPRVTEWQQFIAKKGADLGEWGADGKFGSKTETATKWYQMRQEVPQTGVVDAVTLVAAIEKGFQPSPALPPATNVAPNAAPNTSVALAASTEEITVVPEDKPEKTPLFQREAWKGGPSVGTAVGGLAVLGGLGALAVMVFSDSGAQPAAGLVNMEPEYGRRCSVC